MIIFDGLAVPAAETIVQNALAALASRTFRIRESDEVLGSITFSAGVVPLGENWSASLKQSDQLLYDAKASGRNRVIAEDLKAKAA